MNVEFLIRTSLIRSPGFIPGCHQNSNEPEWGHEAQGGTFPFNTSASSVSSVAMTTNQYFKLHQPLFWCHCCQGSPHQVARNAQQRVPTGNPPGAVRVLLFEKYQD
jgi:hypothetical protein